jgi:ankyrin repeat protein
MKKSSKKRNKLKRATKEDINIMELINDNNIKEIINNLDKIPLDKPIHLDKYLICYAGYLNRLDLLEAILKKHKVWNYKDNLGMTIVHLAALNGFCDILKFLADKYKDEILEVKNNIGSNIFFYIIDNPQCFETIKKLNLKKYINEENEYKNTPLTQVIEQLADLTEVKINKLNQTYRQIQPKIIIKKYDEKNPLFKSFKLLLEYGADPNIKLAEPPIVRAARMNLIDIVEELVKYKCNVNIEDKAGKTALGWAIYNNNLDMIKLLIKNNANIDVHTILGESYLPILAINFGNDDIIEYVLEQKFNYEFTDYNYNTIAHIVLLNSMEYSVSIIKKILKNTKNFNRPNLDGNSIGILLCWLDFELLKNLMDILIDKRINLYLKNKEGRTGFDYIQDGDKKKIITEIISKGLEKQLKNKEYVQPKEYDNIEDLIFNKKVTCLYTKEEIEGDKLENNIKIVEYPYANFNLFKNWYFDDLVMFGLIFQRNNDIMTIPIIEREELINIDKYKIKANNKFENKINMINQHYTFMLYYFSEILTCDILWFDKNHYVFTEFHETAFLKALDREQRFIVTMVGFFINEDSNAGHANILIYDKQMNIMERFDPEGIINLEKIDDLDVMLKDKYSKLIRKKDFKYISPKDYGIINSFQKLSDEINTLKRKTGDVRGFCQAWVFWYTEMRLLNKDIHPIKLVSKLLNKLIKMNNSSILEYIRNYANDLRKKVYEFMVQSNIDPKVINNETYPDYVYKTVSNSLLKLIKETI